MARVLCLGDVNVDILLYIDSLPPLGGEVLASKSTVAPGGAAANTCVALSRLGVDSGIVGCVGDDALGWALAEDFRREGVDTSLLAKRGEDSTGFVVILVTPGGERTMLSYRGANRLLSPDDIDEEAVGRAEVLFVSGYALLEETQRSAAIKAIEVAREGGVKVVVDMCYSLAKLGLEEVKRRVGFVDVLLTNEDEARFLSGTRDYEKLVGVLAETVYVKMGGKGSVAYRDGEIAEKPAFKIDAVDTTGAGDAFNAGIIFAGLLRLSLEDSLTLGNAVAGYKCTGRGARHLPNLEELIIFLRNRDENRIALLLSKIRER